MTKTWLLPFLFSAHAFAQTFPKGFQWCVATAGHQIEGDNIHSDWWAYEQIPGKIQNGDKSGKASFHMERLEEDVKIMKDLGVKTYRFSIEWSRIEPRQGEFDQSAIDYYKRELKLLKAAGIAPMVTLHHFVQPQWFSAGGGWRRDDAPAMFMKFVEKAEAEFGDQIVYWITFNEPTVLLIMGYGEGGFPPGETSWDIWPQSVNIVKAHALAYKHLHARAKAEGRTVKVGVAHHLRPIDTPHILLKKPMAYANDLLNWALPLALKTGELRGLKKFGPLPIPTKTQIPEAAGTQDFLGINYYTREWIHISLKSPVLRRDPFPGLVGSELFNWGIDPEGFYEVFKEAHKLFPDLPFYITENGLADSKDQYRSEYIVSHLKQVHRAINELGHPVEGYCHWSLMDNFEWMAGFAPRFGLFEVDYAAGGTRTPRASAELTRKIFKTNSL